VSLTDIHRPQAKLCLTIYYWPACLTGQYCFARCRLSASSVVSNAASTCGPAAGRDDGRRASDQAHRRSARPTVHGGPVWLRT